MTKKRLKKKDMHILKIQGNSKYCKQQGNWNCEDCYIIGPICTNQKFYKKHISKKHKISCHNLFLLGKRKPTWYLTLQEDHNVSNYGLFYFGPVIPNMDISSKPPFPPPPPPPPQKSKILGLFLPKFNWHYGISEMVSLNTRRLRQLNLYRFF